MNRQRLSWRRSEQSRKSTGGVELVPSLTLRIDRYLVAPDLEHTMRIAEWHQAYPEAKCIGVEGVVEKKPEIKWEGVMGQGGETKTYGFEDEVCATVP